MLFIVSNILLGNVFKLRDSDGSCQDSLRYTCGEDVKQGSQNHLHGLPSSLVMSDTCFVQCDLEKLIPLISKSRSETRSLTPNDLWKVMRNRSKDCYTNLFS